MTNWTPERVAALRDARGQTCIEFARSLRCGRNTVLSWTATGPNHRAPGPELTKRLNRLKWHPVGRR